MSSSFDPRHRIAGVNYRGPAEVAKFVSEGTWLNETIGDVLRRAARNSPEKTAVIATDGSYSFSELNSRSESVAACFVQMGIAGGERALLQIGNVKDFFVVFFACAKAGVVPICTLVQHRRNEIVHYANACNAKLYIVQSDAHAEFNMQSFARNTMQELSTIEALITLRASEGPDQRIEDLSVKHSYDDARTITMNADANASDVAVFQLSGGSTGLPKIIPRFHGEYLASARDLMVRYGVTSEDVTLWSLPLIHNAGSLFAVLPMVLNQQTIVVQNRFRIEEWFELIEKHRVTFTGSIGPIAAHVLDYDRPGELEKTSLRAFFSFSRSDALEKRLGVSCGNMYGITEGTVLASSPSDSVDIRHRSVGYPISAADQIRLLRPGEDVEVQTSETGEFCFRGPNTLTGYFGDDKATAESFTSDGFFRTGDIMSEHSIKGRRCFSFEGRIRDNINRGGEKIGAEEVESFVTQYPGVADTRVVAMPDRIFGEKACAFVILEKGAALIDVPELARFLVDKGLAKYKCPERIEFVDVFPLTSVGKVDKGQLRAMIKNKIEQEG